MTAGPTAARSTPRTIRWRPIGWRIAVARAGPEESPTLARKTSRPNWRRVALAPVGRLQTIGTGAFPPAQDDPHHQRAGGHAQRQAHRPDRHRDQSKEKAHGQAEPEAHRVDLADPPLGVAEVPGQLAHPPARDDHPQPVAQLQVQVVVSEQVQVTPADSGDHPAEPPGDVEVGHAAPGQPRVRQQHPPVVDVAAVVREVLVGAGAEPFDRPAHRLLRADQHDPVAGCHLVVTSGHLDGVAVAPEREAHVTARGPGHVREVRPAGHLDGQVGQTGTGGRVGVAWRSPLLDHRHVHEDDPEDDSGRVGQRVADGGVRAATVGAGRGGQRRGARADTGEQAAEETAADAEYPARGDRGGGDQREHHTPRPA